MPDNVRVGAAAFRVGTCGVTVTGTEATIPSAEVRGAASPMSVAVLAAGTAATMTELEEVRAVPSAGVPHVLQNFTPPGSGNPHFVQNRSAGLVTLAPFLGAPHFVQNGPNSVSTAPHFLQVLSTSVPSIRLFIATSSGLPGRSSRASRVETHSRALRSSTRCVRVADTCGLRCKRQDIMSPNAAITFHISISMSFSTSSGQPPGNVSCADPKPSGSVSSSASESTSCVIAASSGSS